MNDSFDRFWVSYNFVSNFGYGYYSIDDSQFAKDTILHVKTSANTYTRIIWTKTVAGTELNKQIHCFVLLLVQMFSLLITNCKPTYPKYTFTV
jgi:hypothetical protein